MYVRLRTFGMLAIMPLVRSAAAQLDPKLDKPQAAWYLPVPGPCTLFIQEYGGSQRDTVVALHGGPGQAFNYLLPGFLSVEDNHHLVFYDQRGSLRSRFNQVSADREACPDSMITASQHIEDLELLRQALGLRHMKLVGHSWGSYLAMSYLERYPENTGTVVLTGAVLPYSTRLSSPADSARRDSLRKERNWFIRERPEILAELRKAGVAGPKETLTPQQETMAWLIRDAGYATYHVERWRQFFGGRAYYSLQADDLASRSMPRAYDFRPAIKAHRCKVSVIGGSHDYVDWGADGARRWTAAIPKVEFRVIQKVGHIPWADEPKTFHRYLIEALRDGPDCQ